MQDQEKEFGPSSWAIDNKRAVYVLDIFNYTAWALLLHITHCQKRTSRILPYPKVYVTTIYQGNLLENIETLVTRPVGEAAKIFKGFKKGNFQYPAKRFCNNC